ncbi:MAG: hypothetical protein ABSF38_20480, partial [Verrucomicrobiota bacterium]
APPKSPSPIKYLRCPCLNCGQQIAFPELAIGDAIQCPECGQQTMLHRPAAPAIQSARIIPAPKRAEGGKAAGIRLTRPTAIAALIAVCCLGAVVWRVEIWREREAAVEKTRTALAAELRLLEADLNTGINENDFLRQSARVRAAYDVAKTNLTTSQTERFGEIDLEISSCKLFWDQETEESERNPSWVPYRSSAHELVEKLNLKVQAVLWDWGTFAFSDVDGGRRLLPSEMAKLLERYPNVNGSPVVYYVPKPVLQQVMDKLGEAIRSFLDDNSKDSSPMSAGLQNSQVACSECGKTTLVVWAASSPTLSGLLCPACSKQRNEYPFCLYFGEPMKINGAWFQRQDVGFGDIARLVEDSLSWLLKVRWQKDSGALPGLLVSDKTTLERMIFQLHDYEQGPFWIRHWKSQIEYIEGVICREEWTDQALGILTNQIAFLKWRTNQTRQFEAHGLGFRQHLQLLRLKTMFAAWERGEAFVEPEIQTAQMNWDFLEPSGDGEGWQAILAYYKDISELPDAHQKDFNRLKVLIDEKPNKLGFGKSGFNGYMAFIFERAGVALLETAFLDNALYKMPASKWEELSKLSKTELLDSHRADVQRIIHSTAGWPEKLWEHLVDWGIITL